MKIKIIMSRQIIYGSKYYLRSIDLNNLSDSDRNSLIDLSNNYSGLYNIFGTTIALSLKAYSYLNKNALLDIYIDHYSNKASKINYHYILETDTFELVALLSFTNYIDNVPDQCKDYNLIEIGIMMNEKYRRQSIAKRYGKIILDIVKLQLPKNSHFCFSTDPNNIASHRLGDYLGFKMIDTVSRNFDFKIFTLSANRDFFLK